MGSTMGSISTRASLEPDSRSFARIFSKSKSSAKKALFHFDIFSTLVPVEKALQDAKLEKVAIKEIVLVGGSTRIPKIQKLLQEYFNGELKFSK